MDVVGESREGGDRQPNSETEKGKAASEAALLKALRGFVWPVEDEPEKKTGEKISGFQAAVLLVFVLDAVLLYPEFQSWLESPLWKFALKIAPWMLGATAFAYSEKARAWLLAQCGWRLFWLAVLALAFLLPLVVLRQPIFSVQVRVDSDAISPSSEDSRVESRQLEDRLFLVTLPDLAKPYKITVTDHHNDQYSRPFSITLGRSRIARATLAQIPVVGRLFGSPELSLTPLYRVYTKSEKTAFIDVTGAFPEGFFQRDSLTGSGCSPLKTNKGAPRAIQCSVSEGADALTLPRGWYDLTLNREDCRKSLPHTEVKAGENKTIDLNKLCSN